MDHTAYRNALNTVLTAADLLHGLDLVGVLNDMDRADAIGPILDPTLYTQARDQMASQRRLISAALILQLEVQAHLAPAVRKVT